MREILFRGKRMDNGEFVEGALVVKHDPLLDISYCFIIAQGKKDSFVTWHKVDPSTVGQYTGLQNKNGKRIFEGDIVNIWGMVEGVNGLWSVIYDTANHCWGLERSTEYHHHYFTFSELNGFAETSKVIGDIHDNPELLEVAHEN